jgi:hypothetical protein
MLGGQRVAPTKKPQVQPWLDEMALEHTFSKFVPFSLVNHRSTIVSCSFHYIL